MKLVPKRKKPFASRGVKRLKLAVWALGLLLLAVLGCAGFLATRFALLPTLVGDDYLLLGEVQAKECRGGGGCTVFSKREFNNAVQLIMALRQQQPGVQL